MSTRSIQPGGRADRSEEAAGVVGRFAEAWAAPRSTDVFVPLFTHDVVLRAPFFEQSVGTEAARVELDRFLSLMTDVHGTVDQRAARDDTVFIEWTLRARFGGADVVIPTIDRIRFRDGLIAERVAYADTLPILRIVGTRPALWPRVRRSGMAPWPRVRRLMRATTSRSRFDR